jgi:thioredoxin-dependent peroxiredoxin
VESHRNIVEKHNLPSTLLSDEGGKVRRLYGASNTFELLRSRVTYVIDKGGVVKHIFSSQLGVEKHLEEALRTFTP